MSSEPDFVRAIARAGSQGRLDDDGIEAALYSLYFSEKELGLYGLQAVSAEVAEVREELVREIWAYNASANRARVHRSGEFIVVVWHDGVSPSAWEAVNKIVADRLGSP